MQICGRDGGGQRSEEREKILNRYFLFKGETFWNRFLLNRVNFPYVRRLWGHVV